MAILSAEENDLRQALLAAQRAWGKVEVFGNPQFKKRMALLAVELGVDITNPELQYLIKARQQKVAAERFDEARKRVFQKSDISGQNANDTARAKSRVGILISKEDQSLASKTASAGAASAGQGPSDRDAHSKPGVDSAPLSPPLAATVPDVAVDPPLQASDEARSDRIPPTSPAAKAGTSANLIQIAPPAVVPQTAALSDEEIAALLRNLGATDQFVEQLSLDRHRLMQNANYQRMMEPLLDDPRVQTGLAELYGSQRAELNRLEVAFRAEGVSILLIRDNVSARQEHTYQPAGLESDAAELYRRYQYHPRCKEMLRAEYDHRKAIRQAQEERRRKAEALSPPTGTSAARSTERRTEEMTTTDGIGTRSPPVIRGQSEPHEDDASQSEINALPERQGQQSGARSEENARLDRKTVHQDQAQPDPEPQLAVDNTTEGSSITGTAEDDRGVTPDLPNAAGDNPCPDQIVSRSLEKSPDVGERLAGDTIASPAASRMPQEETAGSQPEAVATMLAKQLQPDWNSQDNPYYTALLNRLPAKLGDEWPQFQDNWRLHAAAPEGLEKDRLAFVINSSLQVAVPDRAEYPQLRALFAASDRNLESLRLQKQQAEIRRLQGGR